MIYPYEEQSREDVLPVSLPYAKTYLHRDALDTSQDATITRMIKAARDFFEGATNNSLTKITYKTYRDCFSWFQIRKTPLMSIASIKYYDEDGVFQTVDPSNYLIKPKVGYDFIIFKEDFAIPSISTDFGWPIEIIFSSGYTVAADAIPEDISDGLLAHVAKMFENRGDAYEFSTSTAINTVSRRFVPRTTKLAIIKYKVEDIGGDL